MNLEWSDEQSALRHSVTAFLAGRASIAQHVRPLLNDPVGTTSEVWRGLADIGATGLLVPDHLGGAGMTMTEASIVSEALGAALHPGPWITSCVTAVRAVNKSGAESAGADLLRAISDGSAIVAVGGLFEPSVEVATTPTGDRLRGELASVPDAAAANTLLILAEDGDEIGLFTVGADSPAVTVTPARGISPTRKVFRVRFDDADATRIGTATAEAVRAIVDDTLIASAADAVGAAAAVMNLAIDYSKTRTQFGHPTGSFQAVQHLCVDMFETVELARSGVIHAAWAADHANPDERHLAAVRTKAFAGRLAAVGDTAIQVFGGIGYTWEHDAHLYLERLLAWSVLGGGPDRYLVEVGSELAHALTTR